MNIVDIHADRPMKNYLVYNAAKGGLVSLTRSLARELGPEVRVNGIAPGAILWPEDDAWSDELARHRIIGTTLLKRWGRSTLRMPVCLSISYFTASVGTISM